MNKKRRNELITIEDHEIFLTVRRDFFNLPGIKSAQDCLFFSSIFYWWEKMNFKPFHKTDESLSKDSMLSLEQIRTIKKNNDLRPYLKIEQKGMPRKTHYDLEPIEIIKHVKSKYVLSVLKKWQKIYSSGKSPQQVAGKAPNLLVEKPPTSSGKSPQQLYIETDYTQITQQIAPPSLSASDALPQLTDCEFKLFEASYPAPIRNWKKTQQAFFEFLPTSLSIHNSNFERFLKAVKLFKEDEAIRRKRIEGAGGVFEESSIMEPHNFIWGLKWNDPSYLNRIEKQENKHKPVSDLDARFQELIQPLLIICPQVKDLHLPSFKDGKPMWSGSTIALSQLDMELMEIVDQLKEELV